MHKSIRALFTTAGLCLLAHPLSAATLADDFSANPTNTQWSVWGDASLFAWNATNQNLEVTWDSSRTNSYFCLSLDTTLTDQDDFSFSFDLRLADATSGVDPQMPNPFQIAVGLVNLGQATAPGFVRGSGYESPNLVELAYFPDPGGTWLWGASLTATMIDWTGTNWSNGGFSGLEITTNDVFRFTLQFTAADKRLKTTITRNGAPFGPLADASLNQAFLGFKLDHLAVCSYSGAGQDPFYSGSILAHGTIDNVTVTTPSPVLQSLGSPVPGTWRGQCLTRTGQTYVLERSTDMRQWDSASDPVTGNGQTATFQDNSAPEPTAFYRIRAYR